MILKRCYVCGIEKDVAEFNKQTRSKDGLKGECRSCQHTAYLNNRSYVIEKVKEYTNLHKKEKYAYNKIYHETHKDQIKEQQKKYHIINKTIYKIRDHNHYINNKDHVLDTVKRYNQTPKGKEVKQRSQHKRRTLTNDVECNLTTTQWEKILDYQNYKCAKCGVEFNKTNKPTKDHILPLTKKGGLTFENTQALCRSCNASKNNKLDFEKIITWFVNETPPQHKIDRKNKRSDAQKRLWDDPKYRLRMGAAQKKRYENPLERIKQSKQTKKRYADHPEDCKKISDAKKRYYSDRWWYGNVNYVGVIRGEPV